MSEVRAGRPLDLDALDGVLAAPASLPVAPRRRPASSVPPPPLPPPRSRTLNGLGGPRLRPVYELRDQDPTLVDPPRLPPPRAAAITVPPPPPRLALPQPPPLLPLPPPPEPLPSETMIATMPVRKQAPAWRGFAIGAAAVMMLGVAGWRLAISAAADADAIRPTSTAAEPTGVPEPAAKAVPIARPEPGASPSPAAATPAPAAAAPAAAAPVAVAPAPEPSRSRALPAPGLAPQPRPPAPLIAPVRFSVGGVLPREADAGEVAALVETLRVRCGDGKILLIGHTCDLGTDDVNDALGLERARRVRRLLVDHGLPYDRIRIGSAGSSQPISPNDSEDGRRANRRVTADCADEPEPKTKR